MGRSSSAATGMIAAFAIEFAPQMRANVVRHDITIPASVSSRAMRAHVSGDGTAGAENGRAGTEGTAVPGAVVRADSVVAPRTSATFPPSDALTASSFETPVCSETIVHDGESSLTNGRSARIVSVARTKRNSTCESKSSRAAEVIATGLRPASPTPRPFSRIAATRSGRTSSRVTSLSRASR